MGGNIRAGATSIFHGFMGHFVQYSGNSVK